MKTMKTMLVAVVAMAMTAGVANAGLGSALKSVKGGLSKVGKAVKQAPGQAADGIKKGWKAYDDGLTKHVTKPTVRGTTAAWKAYDDGLTKHVTKPVIQAAKDTPKVLKTGWKKFSAATGGNVVRGGKKVVSKVKRLFKR